MTAPRPVFLNLFLIRQPLPAVVSILHRVSGVLLYLGLPAVLLFLQALLTGPEALAALLARGMIVTALLIFAFAYLYHCLAGIRFLLLDVHCGVGLRAARASAAAVVAAALGAAVLGIWLW